MDRKCITFLKKYFVIFGLNFNGMKKTILCILNVFFYFFSFCDGQDTAALHKNLPIVNLAFNIGYCDLIGGYGSTFNNPHDNEYCGFANGNVTTNLTLNLRLGRRGWSFTFMGDYIRNTFNATGLLNEYPGSSFTYQGNTFTILNYNDAGNHAYNHFVFLAGFTKTWYYSSRKNYIGIRFLAGKFCFNFPELSGTCVAQVDYKNLPYTAFNWSFNNQIITENVFQIGLTFGQYLLRNWNLFESCDFIFGTKEYLVPLGQITDNTGNFLAPLGVNAAPYLAMFNFTACIAYTFGR